MNFLSSASHPINRINTLIIVHEGTWGYMRVHEVGVRFGHERRLLWLPLRSFDYRRSFTTNQQLPINVGKLPWGPWTPIRCQAFWSPKDSAPPKCGCANAQGSQSTQPRQSNIFGLKSIPSVQFSFKKNKLPVFLVHPSNLQKPCQAYLVPATKSSS